MPATETANALARLLSHHLIDLRKSGLSDEAIAAAGFYSETSDSAIGGILQRKWSKRRGPALVIPFRDSQGHVNGYKRVRPDCPRQNRDGKPIKYESPRGIGNRVYLPPGVAEVLAAPAVELLITEGEKKACKATQEGFPCLGLVGVYGWKDGRGADRLIPDLESIVWRGRSVRIVFDSDLADNPNVADAESRLAAQLVKRGAQVKVVRLPGGPAGEKVGLDDYLVAHSPLDLRRLLDSADDPEPVRDAVDKVQASLLDPMPEATAFLAKFRGNGEELRRLNGTYYGHDGRRYRPIADDYLRSVLVRHLDCIATRLTKAVVSNILACIEAQTELPSDTAFNTWIGDGPRQRNLLAVENGIIDIDALLADREPVLLPHSANWFSTVCLPYQFDPDAACVRWEAFLDEVQEGDDERIAILQEWFGYCLTRDTSAQRFLMLEGEGANGKSVVMTVLRAMLGSDNCSAVPLELFGDKFRLHSTLGKLANIAAEVGELDRTAEGFLKSFTAGDSMQFEQKFKPPVESVPTARLVLSANNRPRFHDRSGGLWRRMILVPFNVTIPPERQIPGMATADWWREQGELPGILSWALQGLVRLREQGRFTESATVTDAVDEYRRESNPARTFLTETYRHDPTGWVTVDEVYAAYGEWCLKNGYQRFGQAQFGREVKRAFPNSNRTRPYIEGTRAYVYSGICVGQPF